MEQWLIDMLACCPGELGWEAKRRWCYLYRWPDFRLRAAEQDARQGNPDALALYDAEVAAIKAAIPKI